MRKLTLLLVTVVAIVAMALPGVAPAAPGPGVCKPPGSFFNVVAKAEGPMAGPNAFGGDVWGDPNAPGQLVSAACHPDV